MKSLLSLLIVLLPSFLINAPEKLAETEKEGFAIVELFTSQGCSSCPPADDLIQSLNENEFAEQENVIFLAYHVDYWNYLGWKDPLSKAQFSNYQRDYALRLQQRVYTPQMIVNGKEVFVGSKKELALEAIKKGINTKENLAIEIDSEWDDNEIEVAFKVERPLSSHRLNILLVQKEAKYKIDKGENDGKTLRHSNIVRDFKSSTQFKGKVKLSLPKELKEDEVFLVVFYQNKKTYEIDAVLKI